MNNNFDLVDDVAQKAGGTAKASCGDANIPGKARFWSSSTATDSRSGGRTCAGSIQAVSIDARRVPFQERPARSQREESRSRWGDRTSNPGGTVRRSQVGSTPILLRHLPEGYRDERTGGGTDVPIG